MLRYYSYYSVGGYKDMYLGNSEMKATETYFLPLLPVWEKRAKDNNDEELLEKVRNLETLPSIKILKRDELYGFPVEANNVISHGAYKIIYYGLKTGEYILSIRDIEGEEKDDVGRSIPFLIAIVGESVEDKAVLDKLCSYMVNNLDSTSEFMSQLFKYDWQKNGKYFRLYDFTKWIEEVVKDASDKINTAKLEYIVDMSNDKAFVLVPEGLNKEIVVKEQLLQDKEVYGIFEKDVISSQEQAEEDSEEEEEQDGEEEMQDREEDTSKSKKIAALAVAILVLGIIIAMMF